jgi:hypothetical protein
MSKAKYESGGGEKVGSKNKTPTAFQPSGFKFLERETGFEAPNYQMDKHQNIK